MSHETDTHPANKTKLLPLSGNDGNRPKRFDTTLALTEKKYASGIRGDILTLSPNGAFIKGVPEREGKIIDLEFAFPGQKVPFRVIGRVMWARSAHDADPDTGKFMGMGIRFNRFTSGTPEELETLLKHWEGNYEKSATTMSARLQVVEQKPSHDTEIIPAIPLPRDLPDDEIDQAFDVLLSPFDR